MADKADKADKVDERTHVRISPSVYARAFGEELILLEFGRGEYFGLDAVGAAVWRRLEAGDAVGAVAEHVAAVFDVGRETALRDIVALVAEMWSASLLEPV